MDKYISGPQLWSEREAPLFPNHGARVGHDLCYDVSQCSVSFADGSGPLTLHSVVAHAVRDQFTLCTPIVPTAKGNTEDPAQCIPVLGWCELKPRRRVTNQSSGMRGTKTQETSLFGRACGGGYESSSCAYTTSESCLWSYLLCSRCGASGAPICCW